MSHSQKPLSLNQFCQFISEVVCTPSNRNENNIITSSKLIDWQGFLSEQLGYSLIPIKSTILQLKNASLLLAYHPKEGAILIKNPIEIFSYNSSKILCLSTGVERKFDEAELDEISDLFVIADDFNWNGKVDVDTIIEYLQFPTKKANQQLLKVNFLSSLLISLLFMSGLDTFNFIVPSHSVTSYFSVLILVLFIIAFFFCSRYLIYRVQIWLNSITTQREQYLYLSMLSHLPIEKHTRFNELISEASELGKLKIGLRNTLAACVALIPLAISIFHRMPFILVIIPILLTFTLSLIELFRKKEVNNLTSQLYSNQLEAQTTLYQAVHNIKPNLFYGRINRAFENYKSKIVDGLTYDYDVKVHSFHNELNTQLLQGLALVITMLITERFISYSSELPILTIGSAYMMLYLTNTIFRAFPRLIKAIEFRQDISQKVELLEDTLNDIVSSNKHSQANLSKLEINFHDLVLPHNCVFSGKESLSMTLPAHSLIEITGKSGSGKSTFLRCLLGLEQPKSGSINIADVASHLLTNLERNLLFAYLSQDTQLVTGSLRDNLTLLCTSDITDDEIWEQLKLVELYEKFNALPLKLDTPIMSSGSSFSTGECQRILLAQLLLKPAKIIVLDEALSGLPAENEITIINNIRARYCYIFRVSHRHDVALKPDYNIALGD